MSEFMINFKRSNLIKEYNEEIADNLCKIDALKKIERLYKKDGGDFANLQKNWNNCRIYNEWGLGHRLYYYYKNGTNHCEDCLYITIHKDKLSEEDKKTHEVSHSDYYGNALDYLMTNDEIEQRIKDEIVKLTKSNEAMNTLITMINNNQVTIISNIEALVKEYEELGNNGCSLYTNSSSPAYHLFYSLHKYFY